jgi:D-beta-D-heptose 7-phosphate kinase/D-beta-D-heptose 1-phosphate adenosyltransferase
VDTEASNDITNDIEEQILSALQEKAKQGYKALILSDYGKGMLTKRLTREIIALCNEHNIKVLADPKGTDYSKYQGADVVTPNKKELSESIGNRPTDTDQDVLEATKELLKTSGIKSVVATRSADGMSIKEASDNDVITHLPTIAREVFDVSGAGDTVIATVAAGLAAGADLVMAAAIANAAGGLVVEKVGTAAIRASELRGFLLEDGHRLFKTSAVNENPSTEENAAVTQYNMAPILSWSDAADQVERWRAKGLKIGFTNGAFDILHQGHVTYLAKSGARCDKLIVGLNCDASIKRYKSEDRPVNAEAARARVLSALSCVDMVVVFGEKPEEEDTPLMLMQALRPDVITKGADYTIDTVVGADFVQSYGGEVALIDLEEGFSTTNTIRKMTAA